MRNMTSHWKALTKWGLLLCLLGYVVPGDEVFGIPGYVWIFWAGFLFCGAGVLTGLLHLALFMLGKVTGTKPNGRHSMLNHEQN